MPWQEVKARYESALKDKGEIYIADYVTEEMVCDAIGEIINSGTLLDEFVKEDRNIATKFLQGIQELLAKIKAYLSGDVKLSSEHKKTFSELEKDLYHIEVVLRKALETRKREHGGVENNVEVREDDARYTESMSFEEQVDAALEEKLNRKLSIYVGTINNLLRNLVLDKDSPVLMNQSHTRNAVHEKWKPQTEEERIAYEKGELKNPHREWHGITPEQIKMIPKFLKNPVMVFDSISKDNKENTICILTTELDGDGYPIIIPITRDSSRTNYYYVGIETKSAETSNFIKSAYGREGFSAHLDALINEDAILYIDKGQVETLFYKLKKESKGFNSDSKVEFLARLEKLGFNKIIHQSRNIVKSKNTNSDEKTSLADNSNNNSMQKKDEIYLELAKDPEKNKMKLRELVSEAADKAGYLTPAYHGTLNNDFTSFDKNRVGKGTDQYGAGFYFASNKDAAKGYGERVINSRLSLKNPIKIDGSNENGANLIDAGYDYLLTEDQAYEVIKRLPDIYDAEESPLGDYYDSYWEDGAQEWMIKDLASNEFNRNIGYLDSDLFRKYPNELHEAIRDVVGYDGVEVTFANGDKFYVAWFDNQMKSSDEVTYDDNGKVIPLSERFNLEKNDFRYSVADGEAQLTKSEKSYLDIISRKFKSMVYNYKKLSGVVLELGKSPKYIRNNVLQDIQLEVTPNIIEKAVEKHNIPVENLENLVYEVQVPVMAFPSISKDVKPGTQNIVVLTNIKNADGVPVVCSITLDTYHYKAKVDRITSIQRKDNITSFLERSIEAVSDGQHLVNGKRFLYVDIKKTNEWLTAIGLQSPKLINAFRSLNISVPYFETFVKSQNGYNEYSMQKNQNNSSDERFDLSDDDISTNGQNSTPEMYKFTFEWDEKNEKYGSIPKGERPARDISVPNKISDDKPISRFARTMMEAGVTPDEAISEFEKAILDGTMTHEVITDKVVEKQAVSDIKNNGFKESIIEWDVLVRKGKIGKKELAFGMTLYNQCVNNKDIKNAMKIAADLTAEATRVGQTLQACRMLKKMTPDGQLYYLEKSVQKMNEEFREKLGEKYENIQLDEKLMEEFFTAKDETTRDYIYDKICQDIADQVPSTLRDKWNSWRYLAMLGNPRTHFRNLVGNAIFVPVIRIKNYIAAVIETQTVSADNRTKSIRKSKKAVEFAKEDFKLMADTIRGEGGKYADTSKIESKKTVFKTKWLERLRKKNFDFLEAEDMWFLKLHYVDSLSRFITARGIDPSKVDVKTLEEARAYAIREAQIATYRDANSLAEALARVQRKADLSSNKLARAGGVVLEGVMPFKKTPLNIAKQGINYSPVSIIKGVYKGFKKLQNGEAFSTTEVIDDFAKGLTGTGVMLLGVFLASQGWISGAGDEDDKKRRFDKMTGEQEYAIKIGDRSYTIEWATPSCLPLFVGVEIYKLTNSEGINTRQIFEAMSTLVDPLLELSVFSGISDILETVQYEEMNAPFAITSEILTSYILQALPTVGGQISRMVDKTKRNYYYDDKNSLLPKALQNFIGQAASKIPFASYLFSPSVDEWGREDTYGEFSERAIENLVSPGYYSKSRYTKVDKELKNLYDKTGDSAVFPTTQQKYYIEGDEKYNMTAEEYTEAKKLKGTTSFELIEKLISGEMVLSNQEKVYGEMTDDEKIKAIKKCYETARDITKDVVLNKLKNKEKINNLTKKEYEEYSKDSEVIYNKTTKYLKIIFSLPDYSENKQLSASVDSYARAYAEEIAIRDASKGKATISDWVKEAEAYGDEDGVAGYILWKAFTTQYGTHESVSRLADDKISNKVEIPEEIWEDVYIRTDKDISKKYDKNIDYSGVDINKYLKALAFYKVTTGDKDENGEPTTMTKKRKVKEFIKSQGWSRQESEIIYSGLYSTGSVYSNN